MLVPAGIIAAPARAQVVNLPAGISTKPQLVSADEQAIGQFVEAQKPLLLGADPEAMRRARHEILTTLQSQDVSVSYRLTLGKSLVPVIKDLIASGDETKIINALRMAGDLGTQPCVEILISKLGDPKATIRLAAAAGINRALESLSRQAPAMQSGPALTLVNALAARLQVEDDLIAADPMIRGLVAALNIGDPNFAEARSVALTQLCVIMSDRVRALGVTPASDRMMENIIRAGVAARDALAGPGGRSVPPEAIKAAAGFGGDVLAYLQGLLKAGVFPQIAQNDEQDVQDQKQRDRGPAVQLALVAENIVFFARSATEPNTPDATRLSESFRVARTAEDARFAEDVTVLIGPQGALVQTYGFPADRFMK